MKLLILGATGRLGKQVLKQALEYGYNTVVLARKIERINEHPNLTLIEGDVTSQKDLHQALQGCTHVINCLNVSRRSDFPWAKLRTPPTLLSDTMQILLETANPKELEKLVVCSAWGVAETRKEIPGWFRWFIDNSNIGIAYRDHEKQEEIIEGSGFKYTIVRPVGLTNKKLALTSDSINITSRPRLFISRSSVARYMLDALQNENLNGLKPIIWN